jgi:hypothetical protein
MSAAAQIRRKRSWPPFSQDRAEFGANAGRSKAAGWPAALRRMMPVATGMLAVIKASLRALSRPMSGSASISPSSASPKQVDDVGGDRDARGDQSGRRSMICTQGAWTWRRCAGRF